MGKSLMLKCPRCKEVKQKTHMVLRYESHPDLPVGIEAGLMYCKHCYKAVT